MVIIMHMCQNRTGSRVIMLIIEESYQYLSSDAQGSRSSLVCLSSSFFFYVT